MKPVPLLGAVAILAWVLWRWRRKRVGTLEAGFWLLAAAGLVLYGTGVIHLPRAEDVIRDVGSTLGKWTYLVVGLLAFWETGAFVGLVAPGETTILFGGFIAGQGQINVWVLLGLVWACAVAGDVTSYFLGRRLGREFLLKHGERVKITHDRLEKVEGFFARYGGAAILLGRFVGIVRALAPFIAGASKLPFSRFLPYDIVGAGLWSATFVLLGYVFWRSLDQVLAFAERGALALGITISVVVGAIFLVRFLRDPEHRREVDVWLDARAHRPWVGPPVRGVRAAYHRGVLPAGRLAVRLAPGTFTLEVMTLLAAGGVGAFVFVALGQITAEDGVLPLDRQALDLAEPLRTALTVDVVQVFTELGSLLVVGLAALVAAGWLWSTGRRASALALAAGIVLTWAGVNLGKEIADRPRPVGGLVDTDSDAYPSGHAAYGVIWLAIALALGPASGLVRRLGLVVVAVVVAVAIGLSRVFLGVHWISDVYGGWGLAVACFALCGLVALGVTRLRQNGARAAA